MNINEFRSLFPDEGVCRQYLERMIWAHGRKCPHCNSDKSWALKGPSVRSGLYECAACKGQFTVTTKTPLHSTKLPLRRGKPNIRATKCKVGSLLIATI